MSNDSLGDRMKNYENSFRSNLSVRMPLIIRVDGCHFHTYTKGCDRPVDTDLVDCMNTTAMLLCKNIQGSQLAYVQSGEISVLINNYQTTDTQPWFDNNLQKMVSVAASIAGSTFTANSWKIWSSISDEIPGDTIYLDDLKPAYFDARAFILPKEEVVNYFFWRQQDCTRNSVQMLARTLYSHKQLIGLGNGELQDLCFAKGFNWNDCPTSQKRGRCIVKVEVIKRGGNPKTGQMVDTVRHEWVVDNEIPIFSKDRNYINQYV